jgi:hypothetical protein
VRIRRSGTPLPRDFINHPAGEGILAECDVGVRGRRGLHAKLLVFKNRTALRQFWVEALGKHHDLGRGCFGAVNGLSREIVDARGRSIMQVDPRYFCLIGLVHGFLSMEIICHEAGHAGFAYAKRRRGNHWVDALTLDEENVCYPAGRIAAAINRFVHRKGLYE